MGINIKIAKKYLKQNKKRTITSIIGIIIVTILLCSILLLLNVYQEYMVKGERNISNWEVSFQNISYEKACALKELSDIKEVSIVQRIGISAENYILDQAFGQAHIYLRAYDKTALNNMELKLTEGRLPENENEIVVSQTFMNIGDSANITINGITKIYKVVGKIMSPSFEKTSFNSIEITAITYLNENGNLTLSNGNNNLANSSLNNNLVDANIVYKNINDTYTKTEEIANILKLYTSNSNSNIKYNEELLHYSNVWNMNSKEDLSLIRIIAFIALVIIIIAITFIYSIFNISIKERNREFANLNSIGATKKQIIYIILWEATILLAISIPIAIILSILLMAGFVNIINSMLPNMGYILGYSDVKIEFSIPYMKLLVGILLIILSTYLAVLKPAIMASKNTIIENIKGNNKSLKKSILKKKYKKIENLLSFRNRNANRSRYISVIVTITVSVFLFIFTQGFIQNKFHSKMPSNYNCRIIVESKYLENVKNELKPMAKNNEIIALIVGYTPYTTLEDEKMNDSLKKAIEECPEAFFNQTHFDANEFRCDVYALDSESRQLLLKEYGINELKDGECILINYNPVEIKTQDGIYMTNYKEGDEIKLYGQERSTIVGAGSIEELIEQEKNGNGTAIRR